MQVLLHSTVSLSGNANGCRSAPDASFPHVSSFSPGHRMQLPCSSLSHGYLMSFLAGFLQRDPLVRGIPYSTPVDSLARCPACPHLKQLMKLMTARALAGGSLSLVTHLLAKWPSLLQSVHLTMFPPVPDFSLMERMVPSSSRDISIACDSKIDSPLLRTIV